MGQLVWHRVVKELRIVLDGLEINLILATLFLSKPCSKNDYFNSYILFNFSIVFVSIDVSYSENLVNYFCVISTTSYISTLHFFMNFDWFEFS